MQRVKSKIRAFSITLLAITAALLVVLQLADVAADYQTDSAHGDTSFGVDRKATSYTTGDCAHCHDTFDPSICGVNELMLFDPPSDETFCFDCHDGTDNTQENAFHNYSYAAIFGGGNSDFTNIEAAFNASGSTHNLEVVRLWVVQEHPEWGFTPDSNPCLICHNQHMAEPNWRHPTDPTKTCIRRPSDYGTINYLWGDDADEQMNDNWSTYQAPYFSDTSSYEPGGTPSTDGSAHPDYSTFCLDCHSESIILGDPYYINLPAMDRWTATDKNYPYFYHGENYRHNGPGSGLKAPYASNTTYSLSCVDCHEAHGSSNLYLLRTEVNKSPVAWTTGSNAEWQNWCCACHYDPDLGEDYCEYHYSGNCGSCHDHGQKRSI